jgi:hypothetical protein
MVGENFNKPIRKMKAKANKDKMLRAQKSKTKQTGDIIHGKAFNRSKLKKEKKVIISSIVFNLFIFIFMFLD